MVHVQNRTLWRQDVHSPARASSHLLLSLQCQQHKSPEIEKRRGRRVLTRRDEHDISGYVGEKRSLSSQRLAGCSRSNSRSRTREWVEKRIVSLQDFEKTIEFDHAAVNDLFYLEENARGQRLCEMQKLSWQICSEFIEGLWRSSIEQDTESFAISQGGSFRRPKRIHRHILLAFAATSVPYPLSVVF